jgi:hypothetical protein
MKQKYIHTAIIILLLTSVSSCEKNIRFNGEEQTPLLVINSILSPDAFLSASASKSVFFLSDDENTAMENADITVFVNGASIGKYTFSGSDSTYGADGSMQYVKTASNYVLPYKPKAGDRIRYEASAPNLQSIVCETVIPQTTDILSLETDIVTDTSFVMNFYGIDFRLKFRDRPNERNYYRLALYVKGVFERYHEGNYITDTLIYATRLTSDDMLLKTGAPTDKILTGETPDNYHVFTDELIDGQEYTLKFHSILDPYLDREKKLAVIVRLISITEDYYLYLRTLSAAKAIGNSLFAEPIQIYNNIKGGIGILGACSTSERSVELNRDFYKIKKMAGI